LLSRFPPSGSQWRMADRKLRLKLLEGSRNRPLPFTQKALA
jgi:hypothetical protein